MEHTPSGQWSDIAEREQWPEVILLHQADQSTLPSFPYRKTYIRNLFSGNDPDPHLAEHVFRVGKFPAIRRDDLIAWLDRRTRRAT